MRQSYAYVGKTDARRNRLLATLFTLIE
jgi:hypothetical protein